MVTLTRPAVKYTECVGRVDRPGWESQKAPISYRSFVPLHVRDYNPAGNY